MIFCQDITVEVPDSSCQLEKVDVLIPPTADHTSHILFQEASPIIQYSKGSTQHIPPSSHVIISTPINISDSMAGNVIALEWDEFNFIIDDEEVDKEVEEEEEFGEKTLHDIADEEEKDVYDPAVLGKILICCHFFVFLFISSFISSPIHFSHLSIRPSFYSSIHHSFYPSFYPFIHLLYSFHSSIKPSPLGCPPPTPEHIDKLKQSFGHSSFKP